jgi:hypothetical protein
VIGAILIWYKKSILYLIPIALFLQLGYSDLRNNIEITTLYSVIFLVMIVIDSVKNRKFTQVGALTIPLLILTVLSIITWINAPDTFSWFAGFAQIVTTLVLYIYFLNTVDKSENNYLNISKLFLYLGLFVTLEMFYFLYDTQLPIIDVIRMRQINLGWENLNVVIYHNILSIPLAAYLVMHEKNKIFYMILALFSLVGILLTLSRSSILTVAVMVLFIAPYMFITAKEQRKSLLINTGIFIVTVVVIGLILERYGVISGYLDSLLGRDLFRYQDRYEIILVAKDILLQYPIFGGGGLYTSRVYLQDIGAINYHNTIAQASTLGFTGLIAFVYLFVQKTRLIIKPKSHMKYYLLVLLFTTAFVNGSLQPMYFYTTYLVSIFLLIAIYEKQEFEVLKPTTDS